MYSERGFIGIGGRKRSVLAGCVEKEISGNGWVKFFNMYRSCRTGLGRFAEVRAHHWVIVRGKICACCAEEGSRGSSVHLRSARCLAGLYLSPETACGPALLSNSK